MPTQPQPILRNRELLRPTIAAVVSVDGDMVTVKALLDSLGGYEEYEYPAIGAAHFRADDVVIVLYRSEDPRHGVVLGAIGEGGESSWHTHLMGVDGGTRVIADDYSLVVPFFEIETGETLEIAAGGILMIIG
jgi:hypothetical protein